MGTLHQGAPAAKREGIFIRHDKLDTGACEGFFRRLKVETLRQELERVGNRLLHGHG